jgi:hypothetical protein
MKRPLILLCFWLLAAAGAGLGASSCGAAEPDGLAALRDMAWADDLLDRMIGQTIMVGFSGADEHDPGVKAVRDELARGLIGGVVLYPENIRSPRQLRLLTAYLLNPTPPSCRSSPWIRRAGACRGSRREAATSTTRRRRRWDAMRR